jgi:hypothetical protein
MFTLNGRELGFNGLNENAKGVAVPIQVSNGDGALGIEKGVASGHVFFVGGGWVGDDSLGGGDGALDIDGCKGGSVPGAKVDEGLL